MTKEDVERQAKLLAADSLEGETDVERVYWFPDDGQVRIVQLTEVTSAADDGAVHPFYFNPSPKSDLPAWSGVAMMRPGEFGKLTLPPSWGNWDRAILLGRRS